MAVAEVQEYGMFVMNFKGDWKYISQLFSLQRYATREEARLFKKIGIEKMLYYLSHHALHFNLKKMILNPCAGLFHLQGHQRNFGAGYVLHKRVT